MPFQSNTGLNVSNFYGARTTGGSVGVECSLNSTSQLIIELTPEMLNGTFIPPVSIPKGVLFRRAVLRVDEVFTMGGTSPVVNIGALGSVATNGVSITSAELGTIGTKVPATVGAGTWAFASTTGTAAPARVAFALGGTSPTVTPGAGKAALILEFIDRAKA